MSTKCFTIQTRINRPVADVFDAVVNDHHLCKYFTERSSGPMREGQRIMWHWKQWGDYPVVVRQVKSQERIELQLDSTQWKKTEGPGYVVSVVFEFETLEGNATMLSISETGWLRDEPGLKASHENCGGWQHMALCLKAYLEHGIDLR